MNWISPPSLSLLAFNEERVRFCANVEASIRLWRLIPLKPAYFQLVWIFQRRTTHLPTSYNRDLYNDQRVSMSIQPTCRKENPIFPPLVQNCPSRIRMPKRKPCVRMTMLMLPSLPVPRVNHIVELMSSLFNGILPARHFPRVVLTVCGVSSELVSKGSTT